MARRVNALVHVGMSAEEAAEIVGCPLVALVQYGNGYAIIDAIWGAPIEPLEDDDDEAELEDDEEDGEDGG